MLNCQILKLQTLECKWLNCGMLEIGSSFGTSKYRDKNVIKIITNGMPRKISFPKQRYHLNNIYEMSFFF